MAGVEESLSHIEEILPKIDAGGLEQMLRELQRIEVDPEAEITHFYRIEELRQKISARLEGLTQLDQPQAGERKQEVRVVSEQVKDKETGKTEQRAEVVKAIEEFNENLNFYQMLGVSVSTSMEDIKAAYKKLVQKFHPDKLATLGITDHALQVKGESIFKKLNEAYAVLSNAEKRQQYDQSNNLQTSNLETIETSDLLLELKSTNTIERIVIILKELVQREYVFTYSVTYSGVTFDGKKMSAREFSELVADAYAKIDGNATIFKWAVDKIPPILGLDRKLAIALFLARRSK